MYRMTPTRRSRAHASIATAASPEVRAKRAADLAAADHKRQLAAAEAEVRSAQERLERARSLSAEQAALDFAKERLAALTGETGSKKKAT